MTQNDQTSDQPTDQDLETPDEEVDAVAEEAAADRVDDTPESGGGTSEVDKWRELALRSQADLENYRKRMAREKSEAIQYANASLLSSLLPVLDNFEMGLQAAKQEGEGNIIYQGFVMVRKQIEDFLNENGVRIVDAAGAFDPNQHEAVKEEYHDTVAAGDILAELRRGYRLNDRLLRAANVIVSKGPETEEA